jgi:hypothetical protein
VRIQPREAEVLDPTQRSGGQRVDGVVRCRLPPRHLLEERPHLRPVHADDSSRERLRWRTVLPLAKHTLDLLALGAAAGAAVALLLALAAHLRVARLRRGLRTLEGPEGPQSVLEAIGATRRDTAELRQRIEAARTELDGARADLADALRHVAVVRYDAFGDMGGRLSFTAALLDDAGDGLVLTSIHGRSEARTYAKGIKGGKSEQSLSPEEEQSIELALRGPGSRGSGVRGSGARGTARG